MRAPDDGDGPMGASLGSLRYPPLHFKVDKFFLLGSPCGLFLAMRGVDPGNVRTLR